MPMPLARAVVAMLILMILPAAAGSSPSPSFTSWLETQMMESKIPPSSKTTGSSGRQGSA